MKRIINGTRYDTDKAILIGEAEAPENPSDFRWWKEGLYRTQRSGRHFIAGRGGAMSQWSQPVQGGRGGGSGIKPLTPEEALSWAERYLDPDEVEAAFTDMIEDA